MASIFQIGISRNTKCALKDGFRKSSHIWQIYIPFLCNIYIYISFHKKRNKYSSVVIISYNMGKRDLPDIYAQAQGPVAPQALGLGHVLHHMIINKIAYLVMYIAHVMESAVKS